jgi:cyclic beta-1,2-glucan synthetase
MPDSPRGAIPAPTRAPSHVPAAAAATPRGRILGNGRFWTLLTGAGTGGAWLEDEALTAWRGDRIEDADGWFLYLRDLEDGAFWSLAERPTPGPPGACRVEDGPGVRTLVRRERGIESRMEVWVDPDLAVECRRVTLRNAGDRARALDLTSYLEVVLHDPRHHAAHPGFSKLFVQTERVADRDALLARRRPRGAGERHPWLLHALRGTGTPTCETDRGRFLGRGRGPDAPLALVARTPLSGSVGDVLDPVFALRRPVELPPGGAARLDLLLAAAPDREEGLAIADRLADAGAFDRSLERAAALGARRVQAFGLRREAGEGLERLAAAMLYGDPALGGSVGEAAPATGSVTFERVPAIPLRGPLVVVETGAPLATINAARTAHAYWRAIGLATTLVILDDAPVAGGPARGPGAEDGIFVLAAGDVDARGLARLRASADLQVGDRFPSLEGGLELPEPRAVEVDPTPAPAGARAPGAIPPAPGRGPAAGAAPAPAGAEEPDACWPLGDETLRCSNGHGGFSARGDEYVIRMPRDPYGRPRLTPRPWINVLANPGFGALVSESGAGCTWSRNSREFRLTPWSNDRVRDPHDEALYLRDEASGRLWSPFPGPIPGEGPYEMRHGFGTSRCRHASDGIEVETEVFVHASDPVKVVSVRLTNRGARARRLSVTAYQRLVLGVAGERAARSVTTWADGSDGILFARTVGPATFADAVAFAAAVVPGGAEPARLGADRETFLGPGGSPARPARLLAGEPPDGRTGTGLDPCFCQQVRLDLAPGESRACAFLLGEAPEIETVEAMVRRLRRPGALAAARDEVAAGWAERVGRVRIETPLETLDLLANGWLAYQTLACRLWARTAFDQSGGAFGFRDQLQDAAAFMALEPRITRDQILLHCAHQFVEGDVLHWWHPPGGAGIRTRFADDLLWLPFVTAAYVRVTGDAALLDAPAPFLAARALAPGEDEAYLSPETAAGSGSVYEHCVRALDRSLTTGAHGLPLFGSGDWNDGMNRVGREGRGESVWMAFFLSTVISDFVPLCERRGDHARAARLRAHRDRLGEALERDGWDGEWYRRGYYDDGTPLGSRQSDECRIDALVQSWATLSGAVPQARCEQAMDALERELIVWPEGTVRLLTPPFDRTPHDPGYIKGYLPGVRENGGQYTHAALWGVAAMARLGRRDLAARLLERMSPAFRARGAAGVEVYQGEPYAVAADIYDNPRHRGRAGWTWYTGSAGWMLRVTLESLLGISIEDGRTLVVRPAIPGAWPGFRVTLRPLGGEAAYAIEVRNSAGRPASVVRVRLDGRDLAPERGEARVPLGHDGGSHRVEIDLG